MTSQAMYPRFAAGPERETRGGPELPAAISRRRRLEARARLAAELRSIALDLLGLHDANDVAEPCASWVRTSIESAVANVCEPAASAFVAHIESLLCQAPAEITNAIDQARRRHEAGLI